MRFAKNTDFVVNILFIILIVMFAWGIGICIIGGDELISAGGQLINNMPKDGNAPGAGYVFLGYLVGGGLSAFAGIALFIVAIVFGFMAFVLILMVIIACSRRKKYNLTDNPVYIRKNLTAKLILDGFFVFLGIGSISKDSEALAFALLAVFVVTFVCLFIARKQAKEQAIAFSNSQFV